MVNRYDAVVVEPHADDAFLSLGGHIDLWRKEGKRVLIYTAFSATRKRAADAEAYAAAMGCDWLGGGLDEEDYDPARVMLDLVDIPPTLGLYLPLGIQHDEHKLIRNAVIEAYSLPYPFPYFYMEIPYHSIQKNRAEIMEEACGHTLVSWLRPHSRKYRHIPLFKDQAKFFHFNPAEKLAPMPEVILM